MAAPVSDLATDSLGSAPPNGGPRPREPGLDRSAARQVGFETAVVQRWAEGLWLDPRPGQRELDNGLIPRGGVKGTGLAGAMRRTALRVLAVAALALAGLLVFGLLPGGRDAGAVVPSPHLLPAVSTVHSLHPDGPNRPRR